MKKIMFNDRYGLTQAVLDGRKTMTRRVVPVKLTNEFGHNKFSDRSYELIQHAHYQVGEVVAIAQSYEDCNAELLKSHFDKRVDDFMYSVLKKHAGWTNKMFVSVNLMQHHIRITNIHVERLSDISDEDCLREGVEEREYDYAVENIGSSLSARDMFAWLIDKVSGKGTWESNPWVFVYEFELVD